MLHRSFAYLASCPFKNIYSQLFFFSSSCWSKHQLFTGKKKPFWRGKVPIKIKYFNCYYEFIFNVLFIFCNIFQILYQNYFLTSWQKLFISWKWFLYLEMRPFFLAYSENRFLILSTFPKHTMQMIVTRLCYSFKIMKVQHGSDGLVDMDLNTNVIKVVQLFSFFFLFFQAFFDNAFV